MTIAVILLSVAEVYSQGAAVSWLSGAAQLRRVDESA